MFERLLCFYGHVFGGYAKSLVQDHAANEAVIRTGLREFLPAFFTLLTRIHLALEEGSLADDLVHFIHGEPRESGDIFRLLHAPTLDGLFNELEAVHAAF